VPDVSTTSDVPTPRGLARVHLDPAGKGAGLLVLGHGAGGGPEARDLIAAAAAAGSVGWAVARVEQPWRVAGRRVAEAPPHLDTAWLAVVEALAPAGPLVLGGRSSGARVACRTATQLGAAAVLALAFPLVPPGRTASRLSELRQPDVPRLVVQGSRDAFGVPAAEPGVRVEVIDGADHGFAVRRMDGRTAAEVLGQVRMVVAEWLQTVT
jgi:predicted alpha/beta-hydrolase family hydrolase